MNAKEARKIIERQRRSSLTGEYISYGDYFKAKGYLEGYADAMRGEEVKEMADALELAIPEIYLKREPEYTKAVKALAAFRAAVGEKE